MKLTRENFERELDAGNVFVAMSNGRYWQARRNGKTQTWKRDPSRIRVPFKVGLRNCGAITEGDFDYDGTLLRSIYHRDEIPPACRSN